MTKNIGWVFPPTNGGKEDGWNDSGIAHFTGKPLSSLARETIQNSLDGRKEDKESVEVIFELLQVDPSDIGGDELREAIIACERSVRELGDKKASDALVFAQGILDQEHISCLRISDVNTTGLLDKNWHALVKMQGLSQKSEGAGGSYGIGKYAPFAVSTLRTVFYWTCYEENGHDIEKFQGKAVLMSHDNGERMQGTGFFGAREGCEPLLIGSIPECLRHTYKGDPVHGTSLLVMGFSEETQWQMRIASSVIENYFYAIAQGTLKVMVEPDEASDQQEIEIDNETLASWFDRLEDTSEQEEEDGNALRRAKAYYESSNEVPVERQDPDLGHCKLFVKLGEGLPSKVALVRRTGMLVTDQQTNLMRFPSHQDFAAMCVFEDPAGNELLRRMESPQHDKFEPDRLPRDERDRGRRALTRITRWIREEIKSKAGPKDSGQKTILSELNAYLPDPYPDEPFDDSTNNDGGMVAEKGFGDRIILKLKPIRPTYAALPKTSEDDAGGPGDDIGDSGGGGNSSNGGERGTGGKGQGDGEGGSGGQSGGAARQVLPISSVRVIPIPGKDNRYLLSFTPHRSGTARIDIDEAGDSTTNPMDDVRATDGSSLAKVKLVAEERISLEIMADYPIRDRALRVEAVEWVNEE